MWELFKKYFLRIIYSLLVLSGLLGLFCLGIYLYFSYYSYGLEVSGTKDSISIDKILNRSSIDELMSPDSKSPKTILLITLDTTRADHLSVYGYPRPTSPFLEKFAKDAVKFKRAFASMSTTTPSHASIMSALYPLQHGALNNFEKISKRILTLPEILSDMGYRTAAFVSTNRHFYESNVAQGFMHYDAPELDYLPVKTSLMKSTRRVHYRPGARTVSKAIEWIRSQSGLKKRFLWLHLFDPHFSYVPRKKYLNLLKSESESEMRSWVEYIKNNHHFDIRNGRSIDRIGGTKFYSAYRLYDSEIRYMDTQVKRFIQTVKRKFDSEPLTVIVGDHGEGMGNHDWWGHGRMIYNEQIRVPLMISFPDDRYQGRTIRATVETNDILPTIIREVKVSESALKNRKYPIEGTPIQTLLENGEDEFGYAFSQRRKYPSMSLKKKLYFYFYDNYYNSVNYPMKNRTALNYEPGRKYSILNTDYKYIYSTTYRDQIYDLENDFYEQRNLIDNPPADAKSLGVTLKDLVDTFRQRYSGDSGKVSKDIQKKLEALGYVN